MMSLSLPPQQRAGLGDGGDSSQVREGLMKLSSRLIHPFPLGTAGESGRVLP